MNLEEKLQTIFKQHFQIKRVSKEIENLREVKQKLGLQTRFTLTRGIHLSIFVEILPGKLKEMKKLSNLRKLEFKIVLKATYPTQIPRVYFLMDNAVELGLNPFHDYMDSIIAQWNPKVTLIDIIKYVPSFMVKCLERTDPILGKPLLYEFFQIERLFTYNSVQTFPVRFIRLGQLCQGMLIVLNHLEVILLELTNFQGGYAIADFVSIFQIQSVQKHKTKPICAMLEVKRGKNKFGIEFYSDQFENIISTISQAIKENALIDNSKNQSQESEPDESQETAYQKKAENSELVITDLNISEVESQMTILQSLVQSDANSKNIKQLVELLKKAVQYFSIKSDPRCQIYLKQLQDIMGNEFMQTLLESQTPPSSQQSKKEYETIADMV